jgi:hypothetical protein
VSGAFGPKQIDYDLVGIMLDGLIAVTAAWLIADVLLLVP